MPLAVVLVMAAVLVLRLIQLSFSALSPLTYQLGPDENYYFRFAQAVLAGGADSAEFRFMDPLYGYFLAAVFAVIGSGVFVIFLMQCLLDAATAAAILLIGRELGKPRAALVGALLYGVTSTALMFSCSLLKEVWVAAFMSWWVLMALKISRSQRHWSWLAFGLYCGTGVALRSTLLLLAMAAAALPLLGAPRAKFRYLVPRLLLLIGGVLIALAPWSLRNLRADGSVSPLPSNAGIVLHQAYNEHNPASAIWIPTFVNYLNPSEIWRGYTAEAERRAGHSLRASEVDAYWKAEAITYIAVHPRAVTVTLGHKALKFFAARDIPINRSLDEEALFSPLIRYLPTASPWLIALGLAGLAVFGSQDRRWIVVGVPVILALVTVTVFWAEDRFRFHALPMLALGAGFFVDFVVSAVRRHALRPAALATGGALLLLGTSFALGRGITPTPLHWDQIVWGYINMHRPREATLAAERGVREQPTNGAVWEALGFLAVVRQDFPAAEIAYRRAVDVRPRSDLAHFDLAKVLERLGRHGEALDQATRAWELKPDPDYHRLIEALKNSPAPEN